MIGPTLASIAILLLALALLLWLRSVAAQRRLGLPPGKVVYDDSGAWKRCAKPLFSARYHLVGKPDYLVRHKGYLTPIEVKPTRTAGYPYESDILQLAAYCLLLEEMKGSPPYGLIRYREETFRIEYTRDLRDRLLSTLEQMRRDLSAHDVLPQHQEPGRCRRCGHRESCGKNLI